jgi:hypothetical protein
MGLHVCCMFTRCELRVHGVAVSDCPVRCAARCTGGMCRAKRNAEGTGNGAHQRQGRCTHHTRRRHWNPCSSACAAPCPAPPVLRTAAHSGPQRKGTTQMRRTTHCTGGAGRVRRRRTRIALRLHHLIKLFNGLCLCLVTFVQSCSLVVKAQDAQRIQHIKADSFKNCMYECNTLSVRICSPLCIFLAPRRFAQQQRAVSAGLGHSGGSARSCPLCRPCMRRAVCVCVCVLSLVSGLKSAVPSGRPALTAVSLSLTQPPQQQQGAGDGALSFPALVPVARCVCDAASSALSLACPPACPMPQGGSSSSSAERRGEERRGAGLGRARHKEGGSA